MRARRVETILEVGCGRGILLRELNAHKFVAVGTEIAPRLFGSSLRDQEVFPYAIDDLSAFRDGLFDMVISVNVLDHLPTAKDADAALAHFDRLARLGCLVVVNGSSEHQTIRQRNSWWVESVRGRFPGLLDVREHKSGYACILGWRRR